jgi:hypothetical protein
MKKLALLVLIICLALSTVSSADVLREIWWGGGTIDQAIERAASGTPADQVDILAEPTWADIADNYTARMSGWLTVPEAGEYTFYVSGDDYQRLYVSQEGDPGNAVEVARVDGWTASQAWTNYESQKSAPMQLEAGQILAFVGIMQEGGGGDGQDWGWTPPGSAEITVIPGELFSIQHPTKAAVVSPANGVTGVVDVVAEWAAPPLDAPVYNVYGGTDPAALDLLVEGITETTLPYGSAGVELDYETTYYWRVDVVGQEEGFVWSFTTQTGAPIIASIKGDAVAPGGDAQLVVDASSIAEGELSYQWYRSEVSMMGIVLTDVPLPEGIAAELNVSAVTIADEGQYYCVVSNDLGSTTSDEVWLDVQVGLIHRWTFDESADGVTIPDVVGGADATLMNGTGAATIANGQATLANDGSQSSNPGNTGDYIDLPNGLISPLTQMTLECWTTWDGTSNVWQRVFDMGTSDGGEDVSPAGNTTTWFCFCPLNGSNVVQVEYRRLGASTNMPINDNGPMTAGEEVMLTLVHDDVAGIVKAYINGTIISGMKAPVMLNEFIDNNIWLGRSQWGDPLYCGSFNELRWYDTARSAAEIAADYLAGPDVIAEPAVPCEINVAGDRNNDCVVDLVDAAVTADEWLVQSLQDDE